MDCRDRARDKDPDFRVDEERRVVELTERAADRVAEQLDGEGVDVWNEDLVFPFEYVVYPTCEGRGSHVDPGVDRDGISRDDFDQDPGFEEDYFSGAYDVTCFQCNGQRVVPEIDEKHLDAKQKVWLEALRKVQEADYAYAEQCAHERRMGY